MRTVPVGVESKKIKPQRTHITRWRSEQERLHWRLRRLWLSRSKSSQFCQQRKFSTNGVGWNSFPPKMWRRLNPIEPPLASLSCILKARWLKKKNQLVFSILWLKISYFFYNREDKIAMENKNIKKIGWLPWSAPLPFFVFLDLPQYQTRWNCPSSTKSKRYQTIVNSLVLLARYKLASKIHEGVLLKFLQKRCKNIHQRNEKQQLRCINYLTPKVNAHTLQNGRALNH